ncbi:NUMOD4 domain-containing protein [Acinetobacter brisouii]|uniref:NUMOD4 domain-containing protein n=1 Tax=Acinetobacter brisouii TaxID=396323 RepID=UPI00124EAA27|nr:NUMOD4 domain-containing protein [Acinetobacter brisouii]
MENWKPVKGYEGAYEVSDLGNVRSLDRMVKCNTGTRLVKGVVMKQKIHRDGYMCISLSVGRKSRTLIVHSLELEAFVGDRPDRMQACHIDGDRANNALSNLRWDTVKENHNDKRKHGTMARGTKVNTNKLTPEQVMAIREKRNNGKTLDELAKEYGISNNAVSHIVLGKNWQWVGGPIQERKFKDRKVAK